MGNDVTRVESFDSDETRRRSFMFLPSCCSYKSNKTAADAVDSCDEEETSSGVPPKTPALAFVNGPEHIDVELASPSDPPAAAEASPRSQDQATQTPRYGIFKVPSLMGKDERGSSSVSVKDWSQKVILYLY